MGATTNGTSQIKIALLELNILLRTYQTINWLIAQNFKNALKALFSDCSKLFFSTETMSLPIKIHNLSSYTIFFELKLHRDQIVETPIYIWSYIDTVIIRAPRDTPPRLARHVYVTCTNKRNILYIILTFPMYIAVLNEWELFLTDSDHKHKFACPNQFSQFFPFLFYCRNQLNSIREILRNCRQSTLCSERKIRTLHNSIKIVNISIICNTIFCVFINQQWL